MFIKRLITSLILIPLVLGLIFFASPLILAGVLALITCLAAWESLDLIPVKKPLVQMAFFLALILSLWACYYAFFYWLPVGMVLWAFICLAVIGFPHSQKYWGNRYTVACALLIVLPLFIHSMAHIYNLSEGKALIVYLLFLIWAADIGAYLVGKVCGKHKLIPKVSPGKSWEGVAGAVLLSLLVAGIGYGYFKPASSLKWFSLALITIFISIFGDLFVSLLKRRCSLKDTGQIIAGHGGILDRLDSLIAAAPVFYLGLQCL